MRLYPGAKTMLDDGFRRAVTSLAVLFLIKQYRQQRDLDKLRHMRRWRVELLAIDAVNSGRVWP